MTRPIDSGAYVATDASLAKNVTVTELVEYFERAERGARAGFAMIAEAQSSLLAEFGVSVPKLADHGHWDDANDIDKVIETMSRNAWSVLVDRLELRRHMSIKEYEKIENDLRREKWPPITLETVSQFAAQFRDKAPDMHKAAVLEVHNWLRPNERDEVHGLKTNTELEIGRKVILSHMVTYDWRRWSVNYHRSQNLVALENVFNGLDGKGAISKSWQSELQTAIEKVSPVGETPLFKYRAFKNGHLHLEMRRLDLLAKLNAIAGGKTLKPEAASGWTKSNRSTKARRKAPDARPGEQRGDYELGFFATPPELAARMVALADIRNGERVLEPSAGEGAIALAANRVYGARLTCIEIHPQRADILRRLNLAVVEADFLMFEPSPFDVVLMNPSFANCGDAAHIDHALRFLRPGGVLVAIASGSFATRSDHLTVEVREEIARRCGTIEALPPDSFAASGTHVNACLVHVPRTS